MCNCNSWCRANRFEYTKLTSIAEILCYCLWDGCILLEKLHVLMSRTLVVWCVGPRCIWMV